MGANWGRKIGAALSARDPDAHVKAGVDLKALFFMMKLRHRRREC